MNKSELKTGMWVEFRNGKRACVMLDVETTSTFAKNIITDGKTWSDIGWYTDDLKMKDKNDSKFDICKVFQPDISTMCYSGERINLIWQRTEAKEITSEEAFNILKKHYGCEVKIKE